MRKIKEDQAGIYIIKNIVNNKVYVGQTTNFRIRWKEHLRELKYNRHRCKHLQNAWNKEGKDNFEFIILETVNINYRESEGIKNFLKNREAYYMTKYKCGDRNYSYNDLTPSRSSYGGNFPKGENHKQSKKVLQYDLEGNFIKEWESMGEVNRKLKIDSSRISECCLRKRISARGFQWRYKTSDIINNFIGPCIPKINYKKKLKVELKLLSTLLKINNNLHDIKKTIVLQTLELNIKNLTNYFKTKHTPI